MVLELEHVSKSYRTKRVLEDVSFSLDAGQVAALAGRNGAGKTTLMDLLMGFRDRSGGTARVLGTDATHRRHLSHVGWMPESPAFPKGWSVRRVLNFHRDMQPRWDRDTCSDLCERFELNEKQKTNQMSRGEIARLALVTSLSHRPQLLLLDDPTLGLDPSARRLLLSEVLGAVAEEGTAVLLSTHLLDEVQGAIDRLLILANGRIAVDASLGDLRDQYPGRSLEDVFDEEVSR